MDQQIRYCTTADGVRLAYAIHGRGPPLVRAAHYMTHLEFDWRSSLRRHWLDEFGRDRTVIRYDERGSGLSDWEVDDLSFESWVGDLETVVDAVGLDRFALLGASQGGAVAIAYAVRHPERVSHLVLYGAYARGRRMRGDATTEEEASVLADAVRIGWDSANPAFRRLFTTLLIPDATRGQMVELDELQHVSTSPDNAARYRREFDCIDVTHLAPEVDVPTLVLHVRDDGMVPFEEGRLIATLVPKALFVPIEGRNHILLADDPAWPRYVEAVRTFLGSVRAVGVGDARSNPPLSPREREVLAQVADGLTNAEIAAALFLSVRTVERHLSNIYTKLGVTGKSARAAAAVRGSLLNWAAGN